MWFTQTLSSPFVVYVDFDFGFQGVGLLPSVVFADFEFGSRPVCFLSLLFMQRLSFAFAVYGVFDFGFLLPFNFSPTLHDRQSVSQLTIIKLCTLG